jgi:hypothetical protein
MNTTLNTIYNVLNKASDLRYVKSINLCEDITTVIEQGKFPFVNISGDVKAYDDIEGFDDSIQRITYKIIIQCATKHAEKKTCEMGKSPDFKGIWELSDEIYNAIIDYCESTENTTTDLRIGKKPTIQQRTWIMQDKSFMSGAEFTIELYHD